MASSNILLQNFLGRAQGDEKNCISQQPGGIAPSEIVPADFVPNAGSFLAQLTENDLEQCLGEAQTVAMEMGTPEVTQQRLRHNGTSSPPASLVPGEPCFSPAASSVGNFYDDESTAPTCGCPDIDNNNNNVNIAVKPEPLDDYTHGSTLGFFGDLDVVDDTAACYAHQTVMDNSGQLAYMFPQSRELSQVPHSHHGVPLTVMDSVKQDLRSAIERKRLNSEYQLPIQIKSEPLDQDFTDTKSRLLSADELARLERRREQNRRAAAKCRDKRRKRNEQTCQNYEKLQQENQQHQREIAELRHCLANLERQVRLHQVKCGLKLQIPGRRTTP